MDFPDKKILDYSTSMTSEASELLSKIERDTYLNFLIPRMCSGHWQGRLLSLFSKMLNPQTILEIGTYTGYSALCLAEGLAQDGKLYTIDINEELEKPVRSFFEESEYHNQIHFNLGNALEIIPNIEGNFNLVFIDADKVNYSNYFDLIIDRVPTGGLIIADNVLWSGKVIDEKERNIDPDTRALHNFNVKVSDDSRVENILIPSRDGFMVLRKK